MSISAIKGGCSVTRNRVGLLSVIAVMAGFCTIAQAFQPPARPTPPDIDRRGSASAVAPAAAADAPLQAVTTLRTRLPKAVVERREDGGGQVFVTCRDGFLTGPGGEGRAVPAARTRQFAARDPHRTVKAFVDEYAALCGHDSRVLEAARMKREFVGAHNGLRTVVWEQQLDGVPVFESTFVAHIARQGELVNICSRFIGDLAGAANAGTPNRAAAVAAPGVSAMQAIATAAAGLDVTLDARKIVAAAPATGAEQRQRFHAAELPGETGAALTWLPMNRATLRLCWDVTLTVRARGEMFRVLVDAQTGQTLLRRCLTAYLTDASYRVYGSDSPSPFSPGHPAPMTNQPPLASRSLVTWSALDTNASLAGWIADGNNTTLGNNVDAHLDKDDNDVADPGSRPTGSPFRVFDFTMDLAQAPVTYTNACVVQLFYLNNWVHDRLYALGFTEAAGNFQTDNFGRGGFGNDAVQADGQDGSGVNNANFSTPPDGIAPRMQMYLFDGPTPDRDGDFDAEIVIHEYCHGLSNRHVGPGTGMSALQSQGLGEGWSDFYGLALLGEDGDAVHGNYAPGAYATYQLGALTLNYYYGIRRYPYSTSMTNNPLTFKDLDPAQASAHTGIPRSPIIGNTADEVHNMGEVWCVTLWEARANLIAKHGAAAGNQLILQLVTDGMPLAPANPNYLQARDAIIQADLVNNGGANRNELWAAFAKRGMGFSASSPSSSTTAGIIESFDVADDLQVTPITRLSASGVIGGPFSPTSHTYTVRNGGSNTISWVGSVDAPWLTLTSIGESLPAGQSNAVTACINAFANALPAGTYAANIQFSNTVSGVTQTRQVSLSISPPCIARFPLDADPGWSREGEWAFGQPAGLGGDDYGFPDPTGGATGTNVFGVNLNGDYSSAVDGPHYLTAGPFDFSGYTNMQLRFGRWLNCDFQPYVNATVAISTNGTTWQELWSNGDDEIADNAWTAMTLDLPALADNAATVFIRWGHEVDDGAWIYSGWNIDDVELNGYRTDTLSVSPGDGWNATGYVGGPFTPSNRVYTLSNTGTNTLVWTSTPTPAWLSVSPGGGSLTTGTSSFVTFALTGAAASLPIGTYNTEVIFSNVTSGRLTQRDVTLQVEAIPGEIGVSDSIAPLSDLQMPFGDVILGSSRTERITITNSHAVHPLVINQIGFGYYEEDFNDGLAQGWAENEDANWNVVAGEYEAQSPVSTWMISKYADKSWDDVTAEMSCRRTGDTSYSAALILRATPDFDEGAGSAYLFQVAANGSYSVWKQLDGSFSWIQYWTVSPEIHTNVNVLRATADGTTLSFHINGTLVWSGNDVSLTGGLVGLGGYTPGTVTHFFDDFAAGDALPAATAVSAAQAALNAQPLSGGDPRVAPATPGGIPRATASASVPLSAWQVYRITDGPASFPHSIPAHSSITFNVIYTPTATASNAGVVVIESNDADEPEVTVALSGRGLLDHLQITPFTGLDASGHPGGPFTPGTAVYQLLNASPAPVPWTSSHAQPWLQVSSGGGTLATGATVAVTVGFTAAANSLTPGVYTDTVVFSNRTTGIVQTRPVTLTVYTSPEIWVSPTSFTVTNPINGIECRTMTIGNSGDRDLNFAIRSRQSGFTPAVVSCAGVQSALEASTLVLKYAFAKPVVQPCGEYDRVRIDGLQDYLRVGAPIIPVRPATILVPYGKKVTAVRVSVIKGAMLAGTYRLPPAQPPAPLSRPAAPRVVPGDAAIYGKAAPWPGKHHETLDVQSKRAYQLLTLSLLPLQYTPTTGSIEYAEELRVEVDLADADAPGVLRVWDRTLRSIANRVDNPQMLAAYPQADPPKASLAAPGALPAGGPYDYVIITTPALAGAAGPWNFQALRDARIAQGMSATIVDTDWIYANYSGTRPDGGTDNPTRIRNFLIDAYQTWGTRYALLGGVAALVPPRQFWVDSFAGEEDEMPVDMYYGCVEPSACTFDGDANGLYGEPTDGVAGGDVDLEAEIYVGRAAVADATEVANFVRKTLTYDQTLSDYLPRVSMVGEYLGFGGLSDYATGMMEQIRLGGSYDGYFTMGFENHSRPDFYDFDTATNLYDASGYDWPKSDLLALMNRGTHVFNHLGHANETYTMKLNTSDLTALTNTDAFFTYSQGCYPGCFDSTDCFAEEITAMDRGAFAVVMNARFGWGSTDSTDGPSQRFDRQYWDAVFDEGMLELGRANQDSKEDNLWDINGSCIRWCYYELTLFGDPAQRFRFAEAAEWIQAAPLSGTVAPGTSTTVQVCFDATGLDAGIYEGEIVVVSDDRDTPAADVSVTMTVLPDDLRVTPATSVDASGPLGGPFNPAGMTYTLTNAGISAVDWTVEHAAAWLDVSVAGGTLASGGRTGVTVSINALANGLPGGSYSDQVVFSNLTSGAAQRRMINLTVIPPQPDYFTEIFNNLDNDLDNVLLTFVPDGSTRYYAGHCGPITGFPTDPAGGTFLSLDDDGHQEVVLSGGAQVSLYGTNYNRLYINGNGYITFGEADDDFTESLEDHFRLPRISGLFEDLYAGPTRVSWKQLPDRVAVTYQAVPEFGTSNTNSFQIELLFNGTIRIAYLQIDTTDGLAGLSRGAGLPGDFAESDLSSYGAASPPDGDGDGIPDDWENVHGLNPAVSNSPTANADSDWMTDYEEYVADTDPTNGASFFRPMDPTSPSRLYGVHWNTNLMETPQVWTLMPPERAGNGSAQVFTITNDGPVRYYRTGVHLP
jgi:hypothetical protein